MKVNAKLNNLLIGQNGHAYCTLEVENYRHVEMLNSLDKEKVYSIKIEESKNHRTIEQNKKLWALMHDIDVAMNGRPTDEMEIYTMCLERANAKFELVHMLPEAEPILRKSFRAIKVIDEIYVNGQVLYTYKVFYGSSTMNTKEMSLLIETALDVAQEVGVEDIYDDPYWRSLLNEKR